MPSTTEITVSQLSRLIGLPHSPAIIDVRTDEEFASDPRLIPGSQRPISSPGVQTRIASQPGHRRLDEAAGHRCSDS